MEKKKLLLVAVSVGVVLLIVIGIPLMMIIPKQSYASSFDTNRDWVAAAEPNTIQDQPLAEPVVEPQPVQPDSALYDDFPQPVEAPHITTLTVPIPETAAVPDIPVVPARRSAVTLAPAPVKPEPAKPAAKPAPAKPAAPAAKTPVAKPAVKPAAESKYNTYWVQTGAFSTQVRAEGARESLESKGISSIIDNRDIDGKTWYRVRVGPYTSETEANYWLALVKSIDGFGESQIRLTQAVQ